MTSGKQTEFQPVATGCFIYQLLLVLVESGVFEAES